MPGSKAGYYGGVVAITEILPASWMLGSSLVEPGQVKVESN